MSKTIYVVATHQVDDKIIQLEDVDAVLYNAERYLYETYVHDAKFFTAPKETVSSVGIEFINDGDDPRDGYFRTLADDVEDNNLESLPVL